MKLWKNYYFTWLCENLIISSAALRRRKLLEFGSNTGELIGQNYFNKYTILYHKRLSYTCVFKFHGWYDAAFHLSEETHQNQILFKFQQTHWASHSKSRSWNQDVSSFVKSIWWVSWSRWKLCLVIPATKFKLSLTILSLTILIDCNGWQTVILLLLSLSLDSGF